MNLRQVWALWHQTGAQCSGVELTKAKVADRNVVATALQTEQASRLKSTMRDVNFSRSDSKCWRCVSYLSNVTPRYLVSEQKSKVSLLWLTFRSRLASLLLRWKTADIAFLVLSFIFHVWGIHLRLPCLCSAPFARPATSLGHQGGKEFSERCPNFLHYVQ